MLHSIVVKVVVQFSISTCNNVIHSANKSLTAFWIMLTRDCLILYRQPSTSTFPSDLACSRRYSRAMKVPVRPTPALQWTTTGPSLLFVSELRYLRRNNINDVGCDGTPWSGHAVKWKCVTVMWSPSYTGHRNSNSKPESSTDLMRVLRPFQQSYWLLRVKQKQTAQTKQESFSDATLFHLWLTSQSSVVLEYGKFKFY